MADDPEAKRALIKLVVVNSLLVVMVVALGGLYAAWTIW
ncbi:hypothetical protein J2X65_005238 [Ancylobacter sp. 3268]|nr:hypothetical protein [Ancylobacter sp. 3268]